MARHKYLLDITRPSNPGAPAPPGSVRHPGPEDQRALAGLMLDAYRGTIDYDGETLEDADAEVRSYFAGGSSVPLLEASWLGLDRQRIVSAVLVSVWQGHPLISYVMTAAEAKTRGWAGSLLALTLADLNRLGYDRVRAFITEGNTPSEALFRRNGFRRA